MTYVTITSGGNIEPHYEQTMDYLQSKYHSYPSYIPDLAIDPEVMSEMGYYEKLARKIADEAESDGDIPLGKLVI